MPELSRQEWLVRLAGLAPLAPLALATGLAVIGVEQPARPAGPTIALAVAAAGWTSLLLVHGRWRHRARFRLGYFAGLLILITALTIWSPWYALVSGFAFPQAFVLFSSSRGVLAGLVAACVLPATAQAVVSSSGLPEPSYPLLLSLVLPLLAAGWVAGRENDHRRALLRELTETQQELVDQAHRTGIAVERARITGELHDTLTQALTATIARLEAALAADPEHRRQHVELAAALAREGLSESRRTLRALGSEALEGRTLDDALRGLETIPEVTVPATGKPSPEVPTGGTAGSAATVRVRIAGTAGVVPSEIEHALYRVAREAVTNAVRHARAGSVHVSLSWLDDLVLLDVSDDGIGFRPDKLPQLPELDGPDGGDGHRLGLATMRQRIRHVGGELVIESAPGEGTVISASVPLALRSRQESR